MSEHWPFHPHSLCQRVPEKLISLVIAGMSERLRSPIVIMEERLGISDCGSDDTHFIYPVDKTRKMHRYPEFCRVFNEKVPQGQSLCLRDSCRRGRKVIRGGSAQTKEPQRCHLGLIICSQPIMALGFPLAACSGGKFIQQRDENIIGDRLDELEKQDVLTTAQKQELLQSLRKDDCRRNYEEFRIDFKKEIEILNDMVERYLVQHRREQERLCRESVLKSLDQISDDPEDFRAGLQRALSTLRNFLGVSYMALFLGHKEGYHVLPVAAQDGLNWAEVNSVHFNWRKAGLPVDSEAFNTLEWLTEVSGSPEFPDNYVIKGIKGRGKEKFSPAIWLLPVGRLYRGVLLVGEWKDSFTDGTVLLSDQFGGRNFLQGIGHILVTYAISKIALHASVQHDRRRDLIVALTAHSIRASLHRFWDAVERVRYYWQKPQYTERVKHSMDEMITIVRTMKKNVELTMASPATAVTPQFDQSEMEIEDINMAALLHNCVHIFEPQAISKEINIVIGSDVDELPLVQGDYYMLELLFYNILDNAIKYSKVNKEVRVYTRKDSQNIVVIIIEDLGWGIPEEDLTQIFDLGFKSQKVKKLQQRGVGLGAHQARQFVRLHGGKLWATSQAAFDGAPLSSHIVRFHIRLPVMQPAKKGGGKDI